MKRKGIIIFLFAFVGLSAQDTTFLSNVEVIAAKKELSSVGKIQDEPDSLAKKLFLFHSLADLLSFNSTVFIKNYGPGALATTSLRGGSASQTALLWNGFNIQNPMLGQYDLSSLPSMMFDKISVEYGGSSSLWGSGAVAGSIHLGNKATFNKGWNTKASLSGGSFKTTSALSDISFSNKKLFFSTRLFFSGSNNDYRYFTKKGDSLFLTKQKFASYRNIGMMEDLKWLINKNQSVFFSAWLQSENRQIPTLNESKTSPATQQDHLLRFCTGWENNRGGWMNTVRAAFITDQIIYEDAMYQTYDRSISQNIIMESENILNWGSHKFMLGANATAYTAHSENYSSLKNNYKMAISAGNKFSFANERLLIYPMARFEYYSAVKIPFTGNISAEYCIVRNLKISLNASRIYRQPTLNELYWNPGGNPDLKPEKGYTTEGNILYSKFFTTFSLSVTGSAYNRVIDDWILWLPGPKGRPQPMNIQKVWNRGAETRWKLTHRFKGIEIGLHVFTSYCLSTVISSLQENDNTAGRQLIYTPRYNGNAGLFLKWLEFSWMYTQQYVGYRFTSSDNTHWLEPYQYSTLRFNWCTALNGDNIADVFFACNNLFNTDYSVIAGRNMPLRWIELGITLKSALKKKKLTSDPALEITK